MKKKQGIIVLGIILIHILSACESETVNKEINSLNERIISLEEENQQYLNKINSLEKSNQEYLNEIQLNEEYIAVIEADNKYLKEEADQLENKIMELKNEEIMALQSNEVISTKTSAQEYGIDATTLHFIDDSEYFLKYDERVFIPIDFIKAFYGITTDYGSYLLIKDLPLEKYLIKAEGVVKLEYEDLKDFLETAKIKEQDDYNTIYELDGLEIGFVEAGSYYVLTKPLYMTERGITIGSTRAEVQKAYGKLGTENEDVWSTFNRNAEFFGTHFYFKDDKVYKIVCAFM